MSDLISRQAAIDLLRKWSGGYAYIETPTESAVKEFEELPSVQPEPEIVRCKDCVKHNKAISDAPYKEYACPLVEFRGKAHGHEFDYQYCAYGKRNGESDGSD